MFVIKTAVIADDEQLSCDLIKHLIETNHLPIKVIGQANDGEEALTLLAALKPDIVFLDIQMPVLNGLEVMEKIIKDNNSTSFVVITAYDYFEYAQASLRLGAKDILLKPVESKQFMEMAERVLGYRYTDNPIFNSILEYVHTNYKTRMGLNECAAYFHMSPNYITRMFKKHMGVSFIAYYKKLKIQKAAELLKESNLPIKEVAQTVGFNNMNYFYKTFNSIIRMTPKQFKQNKFQN